MKREIVDSKGNTGIIYYDESEKSFLISHPDKRVKRAVDRYLSSEHMYKMGVSDREDGYEFVKLLPTQNRDIFDMALCNLYSETGVMVDWDSDNNTEGEKLETVQSILGNSKYRLI